MVEFMEKHGDIASIVNTPQGRIRRQQLWQELKMLLGQIGHGPNKSVEQWLKTWSDLKHRTKKKLLNNNASRTGTGGGQCKIINLSDIEERVCNVIGVRNVFGGPVEETSVEQPIIVNETNTPITQPDIMEEIVTEAIR